MEEARIDFTPLADFLRKEIPRKGVTLILGSRSGGFFRSQDFHNTLRLFSNPGFGQLPRAKQFGEFFKLLGNFTWNDIDTLLIGSLHKVEITEADRCLAKLVKQKVFDVVLSANVDNLLERALEEEGLKELHDFDVFSPRSGISIRLQRKFFHSIIKFFGDLRTPDYIHTRMVGPSTQDIQILKEIFKKELERSIIAIGLDPEWDASIIRAIPDRGDIIWYIGEEENEDKKNGYHLLNEIEKRRPSQPLIGINGSYDSALKELSMLLGKGDHADTLSIESPQVDAALKENRETIASIQSIGSVPVISSSPDTETPVKAAPEVFISYVPEDEKLYKRLIYHLVSLQNRQVISFWNAHKILPGENSRYVVDLHLNSASIILLLISAPFIASNEYIHGVELERAIELDKAGKARVIPVLLKPAIWEGTPFEHLQPLPSNHMPVTKWRDRDDAFVDIVKGIGGVLVDLKGKQ